MTVPMANEYNAKNELMCGACRLRIAADKRLKMTNGLALSAAQISCSEAGLAGDTSIVDHCEYPVLKRRKMKRAT